VDIRVLRALSVGVTMRRVLKVGGGVAREEVRAAFRDVLNMVRRLEHGSENI
jgi:hypothetical protein